MSRMRPVALAAALVLCTPCLSQPAPAADTAVQVGLGRHYTSPKGGGPLPPEAPFVAGDMVGVAVPTNQWYSSVVYQRWSQPIYSQPLSHRATEHGLEVGLPQREVGTFDGSREVRYLHRPAITVAPADFTPADARLSGRGDWHARIRLAAADGTDARHLEATLLRGSPVTYYEIRGGAVRLTLAADPAMLDPSSEDGARVLRIDGRIWAVFAPAGARYEATDARTLVLHMPQGLRRFAVAALPDTAPATRQRFARAALAFPTDTRVDWRYDRAQSLVYSSFRVTTEPRDGATAAATADGGGAALPLLGLYPHQWSALAPATVAAPPAFTGDSYATVRGEIRLAAAQGFTLERRYHGFTPHWGAVEDPAARDSVESLLVGDRAKADQLFMKLGRGTYWIGKGLGATAQLLSVAEAQGKTEVRDELLDKLERRLESWFDGGRNTHFFHDARTGTFAGLPEEYASVSHMNDHHFHYGYWVMAAAHVALRRPDWAADTQWGGMVDRIIADIATAERGRADYPFLRNFDPYESHSWASGDADFDAGNNQESSSEAVNAWAGLILWAEATGDERLRDLGVFLYTSEIAGIEEYWFDLQKRVLAPEYGQPFASMVFGGKYSYNTWWTQEPRQILGINELPITTASAYLGRDRGFFPALAARLPAEVKAYHSRGGDDGTPPDVWQDVIASSVAFADPEAGYALWRRGGSVEFGETRTHTNHLLLRLRELGPPDFEVTADTTLYAVFRRADGKRTYLAWNAGAAPITVTFSDGKVLTVAPRSLAQGR